MNGRLAKKIRKATNKEIRTDYEDLAKLLYEQNLFIRVFFALKIIFKRGDWKFLISNPEGSNEHSK